MKRMLAAALSAAAVLLCEAADIVVDWNNVSVKKAKQGETLFQSGKRGIGNLSDFGGENRGSARIENAQLTVDTTGYQNSRRHALLCFQGMPKYPGQMVQAEFDISCETDGRTIHFFFEGSRGDRKLHYWVKKSVTVTRNTQHIVLKELMPNDLKALRLRFDFLSPDVYRIGNISFGKTEEKETDRSINYLRNGGAERGFYCVMPPTDQRYRGTMNVVRDDKVFHSGKYSFRLEGKADCTYNRLVFGSVPFAIGKPATFSAWMKPGKPSKVEFMLFSAAGSAYIKTFNAGTEWAKYSFTVPNFGAKNMPGILTVGEPAKRPAMHLNPCITLEKNKANTVWVDDVCYQLDTKTEERTPAVYISGRLDEPCGYYRQNRPVKARVKFEASGSCKRAELEYELTGWRGERLLPVQKETLALPSEKEICLNVPPYYLGPMNLKLRVRAEGKVFTHNFYSGVISAEQLMNKNLSLNNTYFSKNNNTCSKL